jgi:Peptidase S24-like
MMMMIKKAIPKKEIRTRGSRRRGFGLSDYQKRVMKQRREELGISQSELGKMISDMEGLDMPVAQANISNLERIDKDETSARMPNQTSRFLPAIERILRLPPDFLKPGVLPRELKPIVIPSLTEGEHGYNAPQPVYGSATTTVAAPEMPVTGIGARDLPVYAMSYGKDGTINMSTEAAEYVDRPAKLIRMPKGHGIRIIAGLGMEPKYEPGEIIFVNPLMSGIPNKDVVLRKEDQGGEVMIRRLISETPTEWMVQQFKPDRTYALPKAEWPICQRIVGTLGE